jgi:molybdopterin molybdotransferase
VVLISFVLPLLLERIGSEASPTRILRLPCLEDLFGRAGVEEFHPARLCPGGCLPLPAKSGYVSALQGADGLLRLPADRETLRAGEEVELWLL